MPCDYKKYPHNWKTEIRPAVLEREGNKCKICGVPNHSIVCRGTWDGIEVWQDDDGQIFRTDNGEHLCDSYVGDVWMEYKNKLVKVVLTIAHLDHDTNNNDLSNLAALCQFHHLRHDAELHKHNSSLTRTRKKGLQTMF